MKEGYYFLEKDGERTLVYGHRVDDESAGFVLSFNAFDGGESIPMGVLADGIKLIPVRITTDLTG